MGLYGVLFIFVKLSIGLTINDERLTINDALRVFVIAYASADQRGLLCVAPALREHAKSPLVKR